MFCGHGTLQVLKLEGSRRSLCPASMAQEVLLRPDVWDWVPQRHAGHCSQTQEQKHLQRSACSVVQAAWLSPLLTREAAVPLWRPHSQNNPEVKASSASLHCCSCTSLPAGQQPESPQIPHTHSPLLFIFIHSAWVPASPPSPSTHIRPSAMSCGFYPLCISELYLQICRQGIAYCPPHWIAKVIK